MRKLLVATAVAAVLVTASAVSGGGATVKLDSTPTR